jgi:hypothetical protein
LRTDVTLVQDLDDRHLGAQIAIEARELDPDRARSDHQDRARHGVGRQGLLVGPDAVAIGLDPRQAAGASAGREHHVPRLQLRDLLPVLLDPHASASCEAAAAVEDRHLVLAEQVPHALRQAVGHTARARHDLPEVERHVRHAEAELVGVLQQLMDLGGAEQRLGRDAAPVEADPAQMLALDDRGRETELARADRGDVAAGPGADQDDIEGCVGHAFPRSMIRRPADGIAQAARTVPSRTTARSSARIAGARAGTGRSHPSRSAGP